MSIELRSVLDLNSPPAGDRYSLIFHNKRLAADDLDRIAGFLRGRTVNSLDLSRCDLTSDQVAIIADAVQSINYKIELDLRGNKIGDAGAFALAEAIKAKKFKVLDLSDNQICNTGAKVIAKALCIDTDVKCALNGNKIGPAGAQELVKAYVKHPQQKKIDLSDNPIKDEGARLIALALRASPGQVNTLRLVHTDITEVGDLSLAQNLPRQINSIAYRTEKLNYQEFIDRNPFVVLLLVIPLFWIFIPFLPLMTFEVDKPGLINARSNPNN